MKPLRSVRTITLPYNFNPRPYQRRVYSLLDGGVLRSVLVWHRRAGKDLSMFNYMIMSAHRRVGVYYYFFPTFSQGKRVVWDGMDKAGRRFLDYIPKELIKSKDDSEMKIRFKNGSLFQIVGTDIFDRIVGPGPVGCIFSEYALQKPMAWDLVRPILLENKGWASFVYTPRGKNHGWHLYQLAKSQPDRWYAEILTVDDTFDNDGKPIVTKEDIEQEIKDGMDPELVQQEFYCSFETPRSGSIYGKQIQQAEKENRITSVPYDSRLPVQTWWDIGTTAIWFTQVTGREIRFIDYEEFSDADLNLIVKKLKEKIYIYDTHFLPWDVEIKDLSAGVSRREILENLGLRPVDIIPRIPVEDGIAAAKTIFSRCWFDREKCEKGLNALASYHRVWDETKHMYSEKPFKDWSSHASDAFRYFAVGYRDKSFGEVQVRAIANWSVYDYNNPAYTESNWEIFGE